jgi:hypothetical protein
VNYAVCAVFFGVVTVELFNHGMRLRRFGEVSETLKVVYYPVVLCVCLGFAVLVLALLIDLVTILRPPDEERQR